MDFVSNTENTSDNHSNNDSDNDNYNLILCNNAETPPPISFFPSNNNLEPFTDGEEEEGGEELERLRILAKLKLKDKFDFICQKYSHDFEDCADIIDLNDGSMILDNGFLHRFKSPLKFGDICSSSSASSSSFDTGTDNDNDDDVVAVEDDEQSSGESEDVSEIESLEEISKVETEESVEEISEVETEHSVEVISEVETEESAESGVSNVGKENFVEKLLLKRKESENEIFASTKKRIFEAAQFFASKKKLKASS